MATQGVANGGFLIGAVVDPGPNLFAAALPRCRAAVLSQVVVREMPRFDKFTGRKL